MWSKLHKTNIIALGKLKEKYLKDAVGEYSKRLGRFTSLTITELNDEKISESQSEFTKVKNIEGKKVLNILDNLKDYTVFPLSPSGIMIDSLGFAKMLDDNPKHVFIIGGTLGLSDSVLKRGKNISFSPMTFSHQIMRVILLEQIFRGYKINNGQVYHR